MKYQAARWCSFITIFSSLILAWAVLSKGPKFILSSLQKLSQSVSHTGSGVTLPRIAGSKYWSSGPEVRDGILNFCRACSESFGVVLEVKHTLQEEGA